MSKLRNVLFAITISGAAMMGFSAVAETPPVEAPANDMVVTSTMPEADANIFNDVILDDEFVVGDIVEGATIGDELSVEEFDALMLKVHGEHRRNRLPRCPACLTHGTLSPGVLKGHCKSGGRRFFCTARDPRF